MIFKKIDLQDFIFLCHIFLPFHTVHGVPGIQAGFRKGRGTRDQIANIRWIIEKATESQKNICLCVLVAQSCPTLCDPMDCNPPGSSAHEIFQARILEWVAISFSRGASQPRDRTRVSCTAGKFFTDWENRINAKRLTNRHITENVKSQRQRENLKSSKKNPKSLHIKEVK